MTRKTPEANLIPTGWHIVIGELKAGDKYWSPSCLAWIPITVNSNYRAEQFAAAIRQDNPNIKAA